MAELCGACDAASLLRAWLCEAACFVTMHMAAAQAHADPTTVMDPHDPLSSGTLLEGGLDGPDLHLFGHAYPERGENPEAMQHLIKVCLCSTILVPESAGLVEHRTGAKYWIFVSNRWVC